MNRRASLLLIPPDIERLQNLCGKNDEHLRLLEDYLNVKIHHLNHDFQLFGTSAALALARDALIHLYEIASTEIPLTPHRLQQLIQVHRTSQEVYRDPDHHPIKTRGDHQKQYLNHLSQYVLNFGVGPAGTGKTYVAIAAAIHALQTERVKHIIISRSMPKNDDHIDFFALQETLYEIVGMDATRRFIAENRVEIVPNQKLYGRTFYETFIIIDDAQNTTPQEMKMLLTRIGFGSIMVITGDIAQMHSTTTTVSGLKYVLLALAEVPGIGITYFEPKDIVRHPLVQSIVQAFDKFESTNAP